MKVGAVSDIFLSYASDDRDRAATLAAALAKRGWSLWWDRTIPPGRTFDNVIEEALDNARCVVVLWSATSVSSRWVRAEAGEAARRGVLVPVLLEPVKIPLEFRRLQAADLRSWPSAAHEEFEHLVTAIDQVVSRATPSEPASEASSRSNHIKATHSRPIPKWTWAVAGVMVLTLSMSAMWVAWRDSSGTPSSDQSATVALVPVPSLTGQSFERARSALRTAGLNVGDVTNELDRNAAGITVHDQNPRPNVIVARGSRTDLTLKVPAVVVPNVVGIDATKATLILANAGLVARFVGQEKDANGTVVSQSERDGRLTVRGTTIDLELAAAASANARAQTAPDSRGTRASEPVAPNRPNGQTGSAPAPTPLAIEVQLSDERIVLGPNNNGVDWYVRTVSVKNTSTVPIQGLVVDVIDTIAEDFKAKVESATFPSPIQPNEVKAVTVKFFITGGSVGYEFSSVTGPVRATYVKSFR